jgi:arylsulfatase A-like enzyme
MPRSMLTSRPPTRLGPHRYNGKWLPSWLQEAGYQTYYTGKLMNGNNIMNAVTRPTAGFNGKEHALLARYDGY